MVKVSLLIVVWYSLASAPDGHWKYQTIIENINSKEACEEMAKQEAQKVQSYSSETVERKAPNGQSFSVKRGMRAIAFGYKCIV